MKSDQLKVRHVYRRVMSKIRNYPPQKETKVKEEKIRKVLEVSTKDVNLIT